MLSQALEYLASGGIMAISGLIALEYVGIPLPTELAYLAGYHLVSKGQLDFWVLFAAIMVSHIVGSLFAYEVGYRAGIFARRKSKLTGLQLKLQGWYKKYGPITIIATQLIGHVRPWASYVAGFSHMPRLPFLFFNLIGSAALTLIMLVFADVIMDIWRDYPFMRIILIALFVSLLAGVVLYWLRERKPSFMSQLTDRRVKTGTAVTKRRP